MEFRMDTKAEITDGSNDSRKRIESVIKLPANLEEYDHVGKEVGRVETTVQKDLTTRNEDAEEFDKPPSSPTDEGRSTDSIHLNIEGKSGPEACRSLLSLLKENGVLAEWTVVNNLVSVSTIYRTDSCVSSASDFQHISLESIPDAVPAELPVERRIERLIVRKVEGKGRRIKLSWVGTSVDLDANRKKFPHWGSCDEETQFLYDLIANGQREVLDYLTPEQQQALPDL